MAKKKRNAVKPSTGSTSTTKVSNGENGGAKSSKSAKQPRFESFPLHLIIPANNNNKVEGLSWKELVPGLVWTVPNFLGKQECQAWVDFCESSGGLEYTAHPATNFIAHRECFRMQQGNATELASRIYQRITSGGLIPRLERDLSDLYPQKDYGPIGCNPKLRLYKYVKGHAFGRHVDGSNLVPIMEGCTEITVLIYLSKCKGGATRFHLGRKKKSVAFVPEPGTMLLHVHGDHCLEHEADPVVDGTKYVLRTDIVFGER
jgi:hypothetical protein